MLVCSRLTNCRRRNKKRESEGKSEGETKAPLHFPLALPFFRLPGAFESLEQAFSCNYIYVLNLNEYARCLYTVRGSLRLFCIYAKIGVLGGAFVSLYQSVRVKSQGNTFRCGCFRFVPSKQHVTNRYIKNKT